jgi:rhamnosyltransferase
VCAVVLTYNPDPTTFDAVVEAATQQTDELLIIDNHSDPTTLAAIGESAGRHGAPVPGRASVTLRTYDRNRGLPGPFNEAIGFARERQHEFILLLDHDSVLAPNAARTLVREYQRIANLTRVGAVEAFNEEPAMALTDAAHAGTLRRPARSLGDGVTEEFFAMNSGLLLPLAVVTQVGGFDESFFADAVDFEYGLRLRAQGWGIYRIASARIRHRLGQPVEARLGSLRWSLRRAVPQRHYYVARDTVRLAGRYIRRFPLTGFVLGSMPFREAAVVVLFYPDKRRQLRALGLGMYHAFSGVRGAYALD